VWKILAEILTYIIQVFTIFQIKLSIITVPTFSVYMTYCFLLFWLLEAINLDKLVFKYERKPYTIAIIRRVKFISFKIKILFIKKKY
jgi:hypothetical protein